MINVAPIINQLQLQNVMDAMWRVFGVAHFYTDEGPRLMSIKYVEQIRAAILSQNHMAGYAPYNASYKKWKEEVGKGGLGFWRLRGDLLTALGSHKDPQGGWVGGIPAGRMDSGGKSWYGKLDRGEPKSIAMYGNVMEFGWARRTRKGGGVHPPRPLFEPLLNDFKQLTAPIMGETFLQQLENEWR